MILLSDRSLGREKLFLAIKEGRKEEGKGPKGQMRSS